MTQREGVWRQGRWIETEPVATGVPARPKRRWQRQFVTVPWIWVKVLKAAKNIATYRMVHYLLYEYWRNGGRPVKLTTVVMADIGVGRHAKFRALRELERLSLVSVEYHRGKAPVVTPLHTESGVGGVG